MQHTNIFNLPFITGFSKINSIRNVAGCVFLAFMMGFMAASGQSANDTLHDSTTKRDSVKRRYNGTFLVVLDAGHGGHDPGARGRYSMEKNVALDITLKLGAMIQKNCPDVKVIFTRTSDEFVELSERANIANRNHADLFLCIHCNSVKNRRAASPMGTQTYVLGLRDASRNLEVAMRENSVIQLEDNYQQKYDGFDPNSPESYIIFSMFQGRNLKKSFKIANAIQSEFYKNERGDLGVRQEPLLVLRNITMPGVLVETGYISSPTEENYLNSDDGQDTIARSILGAFLTYKASVTR